MAEKKRTRRTAEELAVARQEQIDKLKASITEIEGKKAAMIASYDNRIAAIKEKIELLSNPKPQKKAGRKAAKKRRTQAMKIHDLVKQVRKSGMNMDEIASKLGVELEQ